LLTRYQVRQRTFDRAILQPTRLASLDLPEIEPRHADLSLADLSGADLSGAVLSKADLTGATVTDEQLAQAASLEGTTMPDGTVHE
jgi:uncharacterized protein YjbI with pentapeptide repeats